jgi:hypothetical protein
MAEGQFGEFSMRKIWLGGVMGAALFCSTGMVLAQTVLEITPQQERTVYTNIYGQRVVTETTPQFDVSVGAVLPGEVQLYEVPATVEYAPVRQYRYVTVGDRVVLVEPATRRVIRVIAPTSDLQRDKVQQ